MSQIDCSTPCTSIELRIMSESGGIANWLCLMTFLRERLTHENKVLLSFSL